MTMNFLGFASDTLVKCLKLNNVKIIHDFGGKFASMLQIL